MCARALVMGFLSVCSSLGGPGGWSFLPEEPGLTKKFVGEIAKLERTPAERAKRPTEHRAAKYLYKAHLYLVLTSTLSTVCLPWISAEGAGPASKAITLATPALAPLDHRRFLRFTDHAIRSRSRGPPCLGDGRRGPPSKLELQRPLGRYISSSKTTEFTAIRGQGLTFNVKLCVKTRFLTRLSSSCKQF